MRIFRLLIFVFLVVLYSCKKEEDLFVPELDWDLFNSPDAVALNDSVQKSLEGVYEIGNGADIFGNNAVVIWSYIIEGNENIHHISIFCQKDIIYFILQAKELNGSILLSGYWRRMLSNETGVARITISPENGADILLNNNKPTEGSVVLEGLFGTGQTLPDKTVTFTFLRPLKQSVPLRALAHRGGGRTFDLLPASENSIEIIKMAPRFGATGVEIDVKLTKDGIPVLYHDNTLNDRLIQKCGLYGPIEDYNFAQLSAIVRLKNGEKIPKLEDVLSAIIYQTQLEVVWLDIKYNGSLLSVYQLQEEFTQKAQAANRQVEILIGIPDEDVFNNFKELPNYNAIPSLCELSPDMAREINAEVWAPRWTSGLQNSEVMQMQAENRRVYTWTLDVPAYVQQFINEGNFDGILSNFPSQLAYYKYAKP